MFAASLVPDTTTRNKLITSVVNFLSTGPCTLPWCDLYQVNTGDVSATFVNRPVVGGVYSLLARDLPVKPLGATSIPTNSAMALSMPISILLVSVLSHDIAHSLTQLLDLHLSCNYSPGITHSAYCKDIFSFDSRFRGFISFFLYHYF